MAKLKNNPETRKCLPFGKGGLKNWIQNDERSIEQKAIIMFYHGKSFDSISRLLYIRLPDLKKLIFNLYETIEKNKDKEIKLAIDTKFKRQENFSPWNSLIIDSAFNQTKKAN